MAIMIMVGALLHGQRRSIRGMGTVQEEATPGKRNSHA